MKQLSDQLTLAPTDLSNFLSCRHLVSLDLQAARGETERPVRHDALLEELRARGLSHEKAYLKRLKSEGLRIVGFNDAEEDGESPASSPRDNACRDTRRRRRHTPVHTHR